MPLIGVGLLYRHGYFRQSLSRDGWQQEHYPVLDPNELPLTLLREADGTPSRVVLALPGGRSLYASVWQAQVGRVPLLLLDSDVEENAPGERDVTDRLYGGGSDHRLLQEMLLGIGGVRAVRTYCRLTGHAAPEVFHTNEGHAGFLGLERIRELSETGLDFDAALEVVRAGAVFTTHTPVPAGIDRFERQLVARHFGDDGELPGVGVERILRLGMETYPGGEPDLFNMAVMGLRLAQRANGVSTLHGAVSREMFSGLWPGFDPSEVPITSVTNGVHAPTWVAPEVLRLGAGTFGSERAENALAGADVGTETGAGTAGTPRRWDAVARVPDRDIWELRRGLREQLVTEVRKRLYASWRRRGAGTAELGWIDDVLDPDVLTVGFARRVPSYKRLTLMLHDRDRLRELLLHPTRPIQIVVAGKAHPADDGGKRLVQELVRFADDPRVRHRIVFLPDYGMGMAQKLYPGCDVWLNNPLRPLEACGTSGMKAALNGCLNLSVRDGWWDEWFEPDFGWAIPTADGSATDEERRDELEANALYALLEDRVAPASTTVTRRTCPSGGSRWSAAPWSPWGPRSSRAAWCGSTWNGSTRPRRCPAGRWSPRPPARSPPGRPGSGPPGRRWPSTTWRPRPTRSSAVPPSWGPPWRSGSGSPWAASTRRTWRCRSSPGGSTPGTRSRRPRRFRSSRPAVTTWRAAGCTRARSPSTAPALTATRCASCPRTRCSPRARNWAWSRCRTRPRATAAGCCCADTPGSHGGPGASCAPGPSLCSRGHRSTGGGAFAVISLP